MEKLLFAIENLKDIIKLDRFNGSNFTRWKNKMIFLLIALKIFYILDLELAALPKPTLNDTKHNCGGFNKSPQRPPQYDLLICEGFLI